MHPPNNVTTRLGQSTSYVMSAEGVQQGDPLGPFLFSMALQPILTKANSCNEFALTPSYLDDITVIGPKHEVVSTYLGLKSDLSNIGLDLREDKCEAFALNGICDWELTIPVRSDGLELLGTPLGCTRLLFESS